MNKKTSDKQSRQWWKELEALELRDMEKSQMVDDRTHQECCGFWKRIPHINTGQRRRVRFCPECGGKIKR
jgi:hypothetical protein